MKSLLTENQKRDLLFAWFVTCMVIVNTLGTKVTEIAGLRVSVGVFFMPFMFLITDIIGEVYGNKEAQHFVNMSILMMVLLIFSIWLCITVKPNPSWSLQEQYSQVFGSSIRMTGASIISFIISQKLDVFLFTFISKLTNKKHLWLRNNLANIISQLLDTTIFDFIAFWHISPKFDTKFVISMIIPYWLFKVIFALLDTPFCYLGVRWLGGNK